MADPKKPENLSSQDLEKPTGGTSTEWLTIFECPISWCAETVTWPGDYSNNNSYTPPKCPIHDEDMYISNVVDNR